MDDSKVIWCKKSARKPIEGARDSRDQRGTYLHQYWDDDGSIFRCYMDHEGECEWGGPTKTIIATGLKWA